MISCFGGTAFTGLWFWSPARTSGIAAAGAVATIAWSTKNFRTKIALEPFYLCTQSSACVIACLSCLALVASASSWILETRDLGFGDLIQIHSFLSLFWACTRALSASSILEAAGHLGKSGGWLVLSTWLFDGAFSGVLIIEFELIVTILFAELANNSFEGVPLSS